MMRKLLLLVVVAVPFAASAAGKCDIASEEPRGSGKAGKVVCVNIGDERSCKAMAEAYASEAWLKKHPGKYVADETCKNPTDPFAKPSLAPKK